MTRMRHAQSTESGWNSIGTHELGLQLTVP